VGRRLTATTVRRALKLLHKECTVAAVVMNDSAAAAAVSDSGRRTEQQKLQSNQLDRRN
jgi:hypothetical protein